MHNYLTKQCNMEAIKTGKFVELVYEIFAIDEEGEVSVFKFTDEAPDRFVFGMEQGMLEAFSAKINGLAQGEQFDFTLAPAEAFGEYSEEAVMHLPKNVFSVEGKFDDENVFVGARLPMRTPEGYRVEGLVQEITADEVVMDFNHQLAGSSVRYVGKVKTVRDAKPEEIAPAHGCGGGCAGCGGGDSKCSCDGGCNGCH